MESENSENNLQTKERILETAGMLFWRYGVKSVTLDDIAKELGISKKTIYQTFKDKSDIVLQCTYMILDREQGQIECVIDKKGSVMEQICRLSVHLRKFFASVNPVLMHDIKKYHPDAWEYFQAYKSEYMIQSLETVLRQGVEEGVFRKDIDIRLMSRLRMEMVALGFDYQAFPEFGHDFGHIQLQFFDLFVYGISTLKGHRQWESLKESLHDNPLLKDEN